MEKHNKMIDSECGHWSTTVVEQTDWLWELYM